MGETGFDARSACFQRNCIFSLHHMKQERLKSDTHSALSQRMSFEGISQCLNSWQQQLQVRGRGAGGVEGWAEFLVRTLSFGPSAYCLVPLLLCHSLLLWALHISLSLWACELMSPRVFFYFSENFKFTVKCTEMQRGLPPEGGLQAVP